VRNSVFFNASWIHTSISTMNRVVLCSLLLAAACIVSSGEIASDFFTPSFPVRPN
jgi:hypothetical protein